MKRFYDCIEIVFPKKDWWNDGCPLDRENCADDGPRVDGDDISVGSAVHGPAYDCEFLTKGGTLGGKVWIDCSYDEKTEGNDGQDLEDAPGN